MATYLQLIRRAITTLDSVAEAPAVDATTLTADSDIKIAEWFNDILEEVEEAADWRVLRQRDTVTISADAVSGSLTTSNERSRLLRVHEPERGQLVPLVFDVTDTSNQYRLVELDLSDLLYRDQINNNATDGNNGPTYFALSPTATGMDIYVWPRSSTARDIEADMIIPQARLDYTSDTDLDTNIKVPNLTVYRGLLAFAYHERGEELGPDGGLSIQMWRNELAAKVAQEETVSGNTELVPT